MVLEPTGHDLRRAREAKGIGLRTLATRIGKDRGHLSRVERGLADRDVTPKLIELYERELGVKITATTTELAAVTSGITPTDPVESSGTVQGSSLDETPRSAEPADWEEPTKRRELLNNASAAAVGAILADTMVESSELSRWQEASALGAVTLQHLDLAVARFGLIYLHTPPVELFSEVRACRMRVARLLEGRHTLGQRRHLYVVAGWLSGLLGHLSLDLGNEAAARAHCLTAWELARESGDNTLAAWVRGTQAMIATYGGAAQEAVALARSGQTLVHRDSVQYVRLAAHEGRALARRGDLEGTRDAFARAEQAVAAPPDKPTGSILSFDAPYLPFYAGTAYGWLGEPTSARKYAMEAIRLCDAAPADWPVARALARIDLAGTYAELDDYEQACAVAGDALDIYEQQRPVDPILRRAAELSGRMAGHRTLPEVVEFEERRQALRPPGQPALTSQ